MAINTGQVVAGCLGTRERTEYSVIGHAVNLAARLEENALPGQILLGPETARALEGAFLCRKLEPMKLQGLDRPVAPSELVEAL
jgi:class 3 adenylate cyclase